MAKNQSEVVGKIEPETELFIKQIIEGCYKNHWVIYSKTKWGDKWFMNYGTKEQAISAAKSHALLLSDEVIP